jgi:hypothetical protein
VVIISISLATGEIKMAARMIRIQNLLQENANRQHHRVLRKKTNPLDEFPDHEILERFRSTLFIVFMADRHLCFLGPHMRIQLCLVGKMHGNAAKCSARFILSYL